MIYMNAFSKVHPSVLMVYFVAVMSIGMFVTNPVTELLSLIGSILFCSVLTNAKEKKSDILFYIPLMLLITVTNPIFSHNGATPLFFMNGNPVTVEAIVYGAYIAVMIVSVMLWCKAYSQIMTSDKFVYLFGRILPKLSLVLSMALRYVPMLKRQAKKISRTQKAMGLYSTESRFDRLRSGASVFSVLIGWSLENAVETGKAMKARGYGLKGRTDYSDFIFHKSDFALLLLCILLWGITVAGAATGKLDFSYYPETAEIPVGVFSIICYAAYGLLSLLPFIFEAEEMIRWKYYRSRI